MVEVTKVEFQELANEYWKNVFKVSETLSEEELTEYKNKEYKKLNCYTIVLPEKPRHQNEKINGLIEKYCDDLIIKNENRKIFTGTAGTAFSDEKYDDSFRPNLNIEMLEELGFFYKGNWSNAYREVFVNQKECVIVSICEGDLSVSLHETKEDYELHIQECEEFYQLY